MNIRPIGSDEDYEEALTEIKHLKAEIAELKLPRK